MKVLNLRCANGHGFEGWFGSNEDFMAQNGSGKIECPLCADKVISRMPSAPRLNLSNPTPPSKAPASPVPQAAQPVDLQAAWLHSVRQLMANTEDVGPRFANEARRIHYGETEQRGIRGQASAQERQELKDEGIETVSIAVPSALKGPVQ